jgi:Kef-type K+ transport system membrane component KefB
MHPSEVPILLILGLLFLLGLAADLIGRHSFVPRVTLLILAGLAVGPVGFDLLPEALVRDWFPPMTTLALSLVGFLLGEKLSVSELRAHGRVVLGITVAETTLALVAVAVALLAIGWRGLLQPARPPRPMTWCTSAESRANSPTRCWPWWRWTTRFPCCCFRS